MKLTAIACAMALLALAGCSRGGDPQSGDALITYVDDDDREMESAMTRARATLPEFEQRLANPTGKQTMAIIKARFTEGENVEHMWISDIRVTPEGYRGVLGNKPEFLSLQPGQDVLVRRENVSDWVVVDDGRLVGGYTMRVMRSRLPADERAQFDAMNGFRVED
jgi:uncharacterized protein YegJ (DUF2314 family)